MANSICDFPDIPAHDLVFHILMSSIIMAKRCDKSAVNRKIFMLTSLYATAVDADLYVNMFNLFPVKATV